MSTSGTYFHLLLSIKEMFSCRESMVTIVFGLQGTPVMTESDLATLVLNMLVTMCKYFPSRTGDGAVIRPLPRIKRLLSDAISLPHIVQLLLTFDPVLVEKVSGVHQTLYSVVVKGSSFQYKISGPEQVSKISFLCPLIHLSFIGGVNVQ